MSMHAEISPRKSLYRQMFLLILSLAICVSLVTVGCSRQEVRPVKDDTGMSLAEIREPDIYFVPTPQAVVDKMLEIAEVKKSDMVYDLGCGDGRIVVTAAKKYGCKGIGYDIDPERIVDSIENVRKNRVSNLVKIEQKDIFTLDLRGATVITLYLLPSLNVKLIPQLEQLPQGVRIVSHDFDMQGKVTPDQSITLEADGQSHTINYWVTPLKRNPSSR